MEGDFRPRIQVHGKGRTIAEFGDELGRMLSRQDFFKRSDICFTVEEGDLKMMTPEKFIGWVLLHACLFTVRSSNGGETWEENVTMSRASAADLMAIPQFLQHIRPLNYLNQVSLPVWREATDSSPQRLELLEPGYDAATGAYTVGGVDFRRDLPLMEGIRCLEHWVSGFDFDPDDADRSRAVLIAEMLTVFCDLMFAASTQRPLFVNSANSPGGGKTLGVRLAVCPVHGSLRITAPPRKGNSESLEKKLDSIALAAQPYVCLDNWRGVVEDPVLEGFHTATEWSNRVLGESRMFSVEKRCLIFVTANGGIVNADMRRRVLMCDFFVDIDRPEERVYAFDLDEEVILRRRSEILAALWSLVREWAAAGQPAGSIAHGTFKKWSLVIGGMMEHAVFTNPCRRPKRDLDDKLSDMTRLLAAALGETGLEGMDFETEKREFKPADLLELARSLGCFAWALDETGPGTSSEARSERGKVAAYFNEYQKRNLAGRRLRIEGKGHARRYVVEVVQ